MTARSTAWLGLWLSAACSAPPHGESRPMRDLHATTVQAESEAAGSPALGDFGGPAIAPISVAAAAPTDAAAVLGDSCATSRVRTNLRPTNLLFVIDRSGSMSCNAPPTTASSDCERHPVRAQTSQPTKWEIVQRSLEATFAMLPRNVRVGLSYFSVDDACGVNSEPAVAVDVLTPEQLARLSKSLDETSPGGGTPLVGATILAYRHLHELALRGLTVGSDVVVLLTDGEQSEACGSPDRCASAQACVALLLDDEVPKSVSPGADIRTFVIGAPGSEPARSMLSQLAVEGKTARAGCDPAADDCHLDMTKSADFSAALGAALAAIRGDSVRCELPLPAAGDAGALDLARLNVVLSADGGAASVVPRDERSACDTASGWQYDGARGVLELCGAACQRVRDEPSLHIDVVLGCPVVGPG